MRHQFRENLETAELDGVEWIHCSRCHFQYCQSSKDWRDFCRVRLLPPTKAGHLMAVLTGRYLLRQFYCPSCAALVDTDIVEEK